MNFRSRVLIRLSLAGIACVLAGSFSPAHAQRTTSVDGSIDVGGGLNNYPVTTAAGESTQNEEFYNVSPAANLTSRTARSTLNLSYAFGWNRFGSEPSRNSTSHAVGLTWSREFSPRWNVRATEYYSRTSDLQTFYALRGVAIEDDALFYLFYPVTTNTSIGTNSLSVAFDNTFSPRSTLSFGASHSIGLYGDSEGLLVGLSDLQTFSANASYSRRLNDRTSWNVGYTGSYFTFDKFNSAVSTAVTIGLSSTVAKNTTVNVSVGPSRVSNMNASGTNTTLTASLSLSKRVRENSFHVTIGNNNASATGVGSVSATRSATAGISRPLGRRVNLFGEFSAFDGVGIVGNPFNTRGVSATANMGYTLVKNLTLQGGVQFQKYLRPAPYAFTQRRLFVSLRYTQPNLLRSH